MSLTSTPEPDRGLAWGDEAAHARSATPLVLGMVALALIAIGYVVFGMPGMYHSTPGALLNGGSPAGYRSIGPADFQSVVADPATFTLNVHVPADAVGIDGTDLAMPYDDLDPAALPVDRNTPIALYCETGAMSEVAATELIRLGFTDVVELAGGIEAWRMHDRESSGHSSHSP